MKIAWMHTCKNFRRWAVLGLALCLPALVMASSGEWLAYVSDGGTTGGEFNVFAVNLNSGIRTQLTDNAAIDNHPSISPNGQWVVWSSTRGNGEFDLYLGDFTNVEATARQLTDDSYTNGPQTRYPDRHCHFRSDNRTIIFTSKNRPLDSQITIISECCVPKIIDPPQFYEGLNVIVLTSTGTVATYRELDIRDAWDSAAYPGIWVTNSGTYAGHPAFSPDGSNIVFSGSVDGDGKVWEVYTVGYDAGATNLVPNSLRRRTFGPVVGKNPIQLSGGAHFTQDGARILFSSTRTPAGNSQIFSIPADAMDAPVTSARRLSFHAGNDYVPEPLPTGINWKNISKDISKNGTSSSGFVVVTDLGTDSLSGPGPGPTADLDMVVVEMVELQLVGPRTDLVAQPNSDEMLLIGDEVSWFCGLKPNLTDYTYQPRTFSVESLYLEKSAWLYTNSFVTNTLIPSNLLSAFGYPDQAVSMYSAGWENMNALMSRKNPSRWEQILSCLQTMHSYFALFPGLDDAVALREWMLSTESTRNIKVVVPSVMYNQGIGANGTGILFDASADYDGDAKADPAVYDEAAPSAGSGQAGTWKVKLSGANYFLVTTTLNGLGGYGLASVAADYDGDGKADPAVYQEATGQWTILLSSADYAVQVTPPSLGGLGYSGIPADYDGDGKADPAVYERYAGDWQILLSSAGYNQLVLPSLLGGAGFRPAAADYDGDMKSDPAIYGESNGVWAFKLSSVGYVEIALTQTLGGTGYIPVPADYDGDGLADPAVRSETGNGWIVMFSSGNYMPVPLTLLFE